MNEKITSYEAWEKTVPQEIMQEAVWGFYAYRKALFLFDLCWQDCEKLLRDSRGQAVADQLIDSVGSVSANIEEGYGRGLATKEYRQFLRYAVASAKEAKGWYFRGRHLLSPQVVEHRLKLLSEIIALILTEHAKQRNRSQS
ncbi:four helix bundle protein [Candidatus Poribacteria bacterium]|nr:four helix bundle protein [Candidatus Poribacteria bacterium]